MSTLTPVDPRELAGGLEPVQAWHPDVHQDDIGRQPRG